MQDSPEDKEKKPELTLDIIIENLRLNRVGIRNLPVQEYAQFIIKNRIGMKDFMAHVNNFTAKQPYFTDHVYTLYDTVINILSKIVDGVNKVSRTTKHTKEILCRSKKGIVKSVN